MKDTKSVYKIQLFVYICNEQSDNEIKRIIPFIIAPKILRNIFSKEKYLGMSKTYTLKSDKTLKEIKDLKKWKVISC